MLSKFKIKLEKQLRLNIGKKLRTAILNSKFTGSNKKKCTNGITKAEYNQGTVTSG